MPDPPEIDRVQSYRVCGHTVYGSMPVEELNNPLEEEYISVGEPSLDYDGALTVYTSRKAQPDQDTHLTIDLAAVQALLVHLPEAASVYGDGQIYSVTDNSDYASRFTGSSPLSFSPYPHPNAESIGIEVSFGQPAETGSHFILTPAQVDRFLDLLTAVNLCHQNQTRFTFDRPGTILSDGTVIEK